MEHSKNYNLRKPDYLDDADIVDINQNMDIIDGELKKTNNKVDTLNTDYLAELIGTPSDTVENDNTLFRWFRKIYNRLEYWGYALLNNIANLSGLANIIGTPSDSVESDNTIFRWLRKIFNRNEHHAQDIKNNVSYQSDLINGNINLMNSGIGIPSDYTESDNTLFRWFRKLFNRMEALSNAILSALDNIKNLLLTGEIYVKKRPEQMIAVTVTNPSTTTDLPDAIVVDIQGSGSFRGVTRAYNANKLRVISDGVMSSNLPLVCDVTDTRGGSVSLISYEIPFSKSLKVICSMNRTQSASYAHYLEILYSIHI